MSNEKNFEEQEELFNQQEDFNTEEDGETNQTPSGEGDEPVNSEEVDEKGVPWKNRAKEYERKLKKKEEEVSQIQAKLQELESKISSGTQSSSQQKKSVNQFQALKEKLAEIGYEDDEVINSLVSSIESTLQEKEEQLRKEVLSYTQPAIQSAREMILEDIKKTDKYGLVDKYRDEITEELNKLPPQYWTDKQTIKSVVQLVAGRHLEDFLSEKKNKSGNPPVESSRTFGGKTGKNLPAMEKEAIEYADQHGIPVEKAREIIKIKHKALENIA